MGKETVGQVGKPVGFAGPGCSPWVLGTQEPCSVLRVPPPPGRGWLHSWKGWRAVNLTLATTGSLGGSVEEPQPRQPGRGSQGEAPPRASLPGGKALTSSLPTLLIYFLQHGDLLPS